MGVELRIHPAFPRRNDMRTKTSAYRLPRARREPIAILAAPSGAVPPRNPRMRHGRVLRAARGSERARTAHGTRQARGTDADESAPDCTRSPPSRHESPDYHPVGDEITATEKENRNMKPSTANVLTALYVLCHRTGLTAEETEAVESAGGALTPDRWREGICLPEGENDARFNPRHCPLVLHWLGLSEDEFFDAHRVSISEAIDRDRMELTALARVLDGRSDDPIGCDSELHRLAGRAWRDRAHRLFEELPEEAPAVLTATEHALDTCPFEGTELRPLLETVRQVCDASEPNSHAERARKLLQRLGASEPAEGSPHTRSVEILSVLWCITHGDMLLAHELDLDPEIEATSDEWERVQAAVREGRVKDIPIPSGTMRSWELESAIEEPEFRASLEEAKPFVPAALVGVECVWGGKPGEDLDPEAHRLALDVVARRSARLRAGYAPPDGETHNHWYEVHQGCRRPDTIELTEAIRRLHGMLGSSEDPWARAGVQLDFAAESLALGRYREARERIEAAARLTRPLEVEHRREHADVHLAYWDWLWGDAPAAMARLSNLSGPDARKARERIESTEPHRDAIARSERIHHVRDDVESWCDVATAHLAAGHTMRAEDLTGEICARYPEHPLAWDTRARVLLKHGRYRDAVEPARTALDRGADRTRVRALLARILSRTGVTDRDESTAFAIAAIDGLASRPGVSITEFTELAKIAHKGGCIEPARRADDCTWELRALHRPPTEWLGAAVARRCEQALERRRARVARTACPDRTRSADRTREVGGGSHECASALARSHGMRGPRSSGIRVSVNRTSRPSICEWLRDRYDLDMRAEGCTAALRAARALGYADDEAVEALGFDTPVLAAESSQGTGGPDEPALYAAAPWTQHLPAIADAFDAGARHPTARERACAAGVGRTRGGFRPWPCARGAGDVGGRERWPGSAGPTITSAWAISSMPGTPPSCLLHARAACRDPGACALR